MRRLLALLIFLVAASAFAATPQGFALGDQPANPGYAPPPAFSFNSTGGAIRITRAGVGHYKVIFFGLGAAGVGHKSNVQVTAFDAATTCNTHGWGGNPDLSVSVDCFNLGAGASQDSK